MIFSSINSYVFIKRNILWSNCLSCSFWFGRVVLNHWPLPKPTMLTNCELTHWGRVTHICVGKSTIIASDNGLSPGRRQAIIWTNAGIIEPLGTNFSEILIGIQIFSFKKMRLKMSSAKWCPFCLGFNVLKQFSILRANIWKLNPCSVLWFWKKKESLKYAVVGHEGRFMIYVLNYFYCKRQCWYYDVPLHELRNFFICINRLYIWSAICVTLSCHTCWPNNNNKCMFTWSGFSCNIY